MKSLNPSSSIAIKLIWMIYPVIPNLPTKLPVYELRHPPQASHDQLPAIQVWKTAYPIDTTKPNQCAPQKSSMHKDLAIPLGCFYYKHITATEGLYPDAAEVIDYTKSLGARDVYALLVGIHVMQLTKEHHKWRWSTFYWTKEEAPLGDRSSTASWQPKWKHFQVMSTDDVPESYPAHDLHKYSYSPYLEGINNGTKANCLSCHSYAAYFPSGAAPSQTSRAVFKKYGNDDFSHIDRVATYNSYFKSGIGTSFLWSVANAATGPGLIDDSREKFLKEIEHQRDTHKRNTQAVPSQLPKK